MNIRPAQFTDMPDIMGIFDHARKFMRENGTPTNGQTVILRKNSYKRKSDKDTASSAKTKRTAW